jgi:hypothetical protein
VLPAEKRDGGRVLSQLRPGWASKSRETFVCRAAGPAGISPCRPQDGVLTYALRGRSSSGKASPQVAAVLAANAAVAVRITPTSGPDAQASAGRVYRPPVVRRVLLHLSVAPDVSRAFL